MSSFLETMLARAKADRQTIVLPEGDDERTLAAAERILADDIADLVILGDAHAIAASPYKLSGARTSTRARPSCAKGSLRRSTSCARPRGDAPSRRWASWTTCCTSA